MYRIFDFDSFFVILKNDYNNNSPWEKYVYCLFFSQ